MLLFGATNVLEQSFITINNKISTYVYLIYNNELLFFMNVKLLFI